MRYRCAVMLRCGGHAMVPGVRPFWTTMFFLTVLVPCFVGIVHAQEKTSAPLDRDALISAAEQAVDEGRIGEALRLFSRAEKSFGGDAKIFRGRGMAREMLNDDRKAMEDYKLALQFDVNDYVSLERLAGVYERGGTRIPEAILLYKRALELDPRPEWKDNIAAWIPMLESRLKADSTSAVGCWHMGNDQAQKGNLSQAASSYSRAIELNPQMFQAYFSRGLTYLKAGDPAAALADFEQSVKIAPQFAQGYLQRGVARERLGKEKNARADFHRAASMDPRDPVALYHSAKALESEDDQETALQRYREALRCRPSSELAAAIHAQIAGLLSSPRFKRARNNDHAPEPSSLW